MLALASPRLQVGAVRGIVKGSEMAQAFAGAGAGPVTVGRTSRASLFGVLSEQAKLQTQREGTRQDAPKKPVPKVVLGSY
jgi:hypothetical protein